MHYFDAKEPSLGPPWFPQWFGLLLLAALLVMPFEAHAQEEEPGGITGGVITHQNVFDSASNDSVACYRIPALVTAPNGDLVATIDERVPSCADLRGNRNINILQIVNACTQYFNLLLVGLCGCIIVFQWLHL